MTWVGVGRSPMRASENRMIQTSVSPEKGARMLGEAKFMASTPQSGLRKVIPTIPDPLRAQIQNLDWQHPLCASSAEIAAPRRISDDDDRRRRRLVSDRGRSPLPRSNGGASLRLRLPLFSPRPAASVDRDD